MVDTKKAAEGVEKSKVEGSSSKGKEGKKDPKDDAPAANKSALSEKDIKLLETYQTGPYDKLITETDEKIKKVAKNIGKLCGVKESDLGLSQPQYWDLAADEKLLGGKSSLHVARCTKIINEGTDDASYMVKIKQMATYVVELGEELSPLDVEAGMRVGCDRGKYSIQLPLPPRIDATVSLMTVEERPDVTYDDIGGCKEQLEKLREVVELPLLHPERYTDLGIDPPKGVLLFGPPGTGKTLTARAVANRTEATFIRVNGSELLQRYVGEGARLVRELFNMARSKKACVIFFDEIDAVGGTRFGGEGGDNEVQRTMLELITQLDGFDSRGNIKVLMATNRPDTLDPALLRPGRLDRKIEFGLPDLAGRIHIMRIHARSMSVDSNIRWEMLAQKCPQSTGADLQAVSTEAGMLAIRDRRKLATEADYLEAIQKVIKDQRKFHANKKYMIHN